VPRTCLACGSSERAAIDKAIVSGEPLRNIAKRVSISAAALLRHKTHVVTAIGKAQAKREEQLGVALLGDMQRLREKIWTMLNAAEREGDRVSFSVLARELRQTLGGLFELAERAAQSVSNAQQTEVTIRVVTEGRDGKETEVSRKTVPRSSLKLRSGQS
jgi:hypothetical protein